MESAKLKAEFADRVLAGLFVFVAIVLPLSVYKWLTIGFLPIFLINTAIGGILALCYFSRKKLRFETKSWVIAISFIVVGVCGAASFGLASNAFVFVVVCGFFCAEVWGRARALKITFLFVLLLTIVATLLVTGIMSISEAATSHNHSAVGWITSMVPAVLVTLILIHSTSELKSKQRQKTYELYIQNKQNEHLANYDKLTSLPTLNIAQNRLQEAIEFAKQTATKSVLLYLDLDGFKQVNDTFGHDAGDAVLVTVAQRFNEMIRNTDTCCRIGGDEFLIILPNMQNVEPVHSLCQRLITQVRKPIQFNGHSLAVGVSIGVAIFPDNAINAQELRSKADEAMYRVKQSGKNNYSFV
ncbi:diguanylate cyclase [Pseudoalteromonas sp. YIC-656]|uniref:diguanylate cyclase domain-containing protein n=1 Tax=Pseudoalteromonas pernae TaxID=3118054 RepID=UPI003241C2D6